MHNTKKEFPDVPRSFTPQLAAGVLWPPGRKPILMAGYMSESSQPLDVLMAAHAEIAATIFGSDD